MPDDRTATNSEDNRLALEEVSSGLWISGKVVRKRTKSGTTSCFRGHEGRAYFFVDPRHERREEAGQREPKFGSLIGVIVLGEYATERWGRKGNLVVSESAMVGGLSLPIVIYGRAFGLERWLIIRILIAWAIAVQLFLFVFVPIIRRRRKRSRQGDTQVTHKGRTAPTVGGKDHNKTGSSGPWWVWPLVWILWSYVITAVIVALQEPALPRIDIAGTDESRALLTHRDGYWYVFDLEGDDRGDLLAIPDGHMDATRISKAE